MNTSRAVIYTRVSTGRQEENTSLAVQFAACARKAGEIGAQIALHVEETRSGGLYHSRAGIQRALAAIEAGEANALIVYRLDRTGRDVDALRDIRRRLARAGAALVFADGATYDHTPAGDLLWTIVGGFAEYERKIIRERTMRGASAQARAGLMPQRNKPPYGFRVVQKLEVLQGLHPGPAGTFVIVPEQARWVPWEIRSLAAGVLPAMR